jgi:hypothetical protein
MLQEKLAAVIEAGEKSNLKSIKNIINKYDPQITEIVFIKKISRDPRHNSKIDYDKLQKLMKRFG